MKELRGIVRQLNELGYKVEQRKNHYVVKSPDGKSLYALPSTPGGGRWRANLVSELRRRGIGIQ